MTGIFVRIDRGDGRMRPVDLDEMTDAELASLDALMARQEAWKLWTWTKSLAQWIRDHPGPPAGQEVQA